MDKGSRQSSSNTLLLTVTAIMLLVVSLGLAFTINAGAAHAAAPSQTQVRSAVAAGVHEVSTVATLADVTATAAPGEGVIRIVTRVCGAAPSLRHWQAVAAANAITAPTYLVLLGQRLTVSCVAPAATSSGPQPAVPPTPTTPSVVGWANPLPGYCISSGFRTAARPGHNGTDIGAGRGNPAVRAAAAGTLSIGWQAGGAGNYAMINHGGGLWTVYMHFASHEVRSGWVNAGQVIGYAGATGDASGNHLHFEVHTGGLWSGRVNPVPFMADRGARLGC